MSDQLSGRVGLDVTQFRKAIADMGRQLRVVKSEWDANAAALGNWTNDITGVESRLASVNKTIPLHEQKVAALRDRYNALAAEQGANSSAAQNMQIQLNKAVKELNQAQAESGQLEGRLRELNAAQKTTGSESGTLKSKLNALGNGLKSIVGGFAAAARAAGPLVGKLRDVGKAALDGTKRLVSATAHAAKAVAVNLAKIGAAIAVGVGALAATTIGPASDLQETLSKTEVVFGAAAKSVIQFGADSAASLGMSQNAALSAAATYGNLLVAMGLSEEAAAGMSTELVSLAADLASFNNMDPTDVLDKLRAGLSGESEPLKTLGINMNEARIKAKALELGLIEQGQAIDFATKAQAIYAIMMEDSAKAQGDFARTSGGLANQQRTFGANLENLRATIGAGLLPIAEALVTKFNSLFASDTFQNALAAFTEQFALLGTAISGLLKGTVSLDTVGIIFKDLFKGIGEAFGGGEGFDFDLAGLIGKMLSGIGSIATKLNLGSLALDIISGLVDSIVTGLPGLIEAATAIIEKLVDFIVEGVPQLIEAGIPLIMALLDGVIAALPMILSAAGEIITAIVDGIAAALPTLLPAALQIILQLAQSVLENLPLIITTGISVITSLIQGIAEMLPELIPLAVEAILTLVNTLAENLPLILEAAIQIIVALASGLTDMLPELIPTMVSAILTLVQTLIENLPLLVDAALQLIMALATGLVAALPILIEAAPEIITSIIDVLIQSLPMIAETAGELITTLAMGIVASIPGVIDSALQIINALYDFFFSDQTIALLSSIGKGMLEGVYKGFNNAKEWFMQQITAFFAGLVDTVKELLGITSPSKVFASVVGKPIVQGIAQGITGEMPALQRDLNAAMNLLVGGSLPSLAAAGAASGVGGSTYQITVPLTVYGGDPETVRTAAKTGVLSALRAAGAR